MLNLKKIKANKTLFILNITIQAEKIYQNKYYTMAEKTSVFYNLLKDCGELKKV